MQLESPEQLHDKTPERKPYDAPRLLEYGPAEELTMQDGRTV